MLWVWPQLGQALRRCTYTKMKGLELLDSTYNLEVRNADIEALIHIGMPHNPDVGDKESSKITLKEWTDSLSLFQKRTQRKASLRQLYLITG